MSPSASRRRKSLAARSQARIVLSRTNMKLENSALAEIAQRIRESRKILERTHQRIRQSLEDLETLQEPVAKARLILAKSQSWRSRTAD